MSVTAEALSAELVEPHLRGRFGRPWLYEAECESTQLLLSDPGLPEGAVAATDHQTAGRGRLGRAWEAPPGTAVLLSLLLRPPPERLAPELTLVAAVAAAEVVELATTLAAQIKWPNDVMLNRRKVGGVVAELRDGAVVLGVGLNANQVPAQLPGGAPTEPGSLRSLTGSLYDRAGLAGALVEHLEVAYTTWLERGLEGLYEGIGARDFLRGRRVSVDGEPATALMIRRDGRLDLETDGGDERTIESGEVLFVR